MFVGMHVCTYVYVCKYVLQILVSLKVLSHFSRDTMYKYRTKCFFQKSIRGESINQLLYRPGWGRRAIALARAHTRHIKNVRVVCCTS